MKQTTAPQLRGIIKSARDVMRKDKGLSGDLDRLPMLTWIMFLKFLDDMENIREVEATLSGDHYRPTIAPPYRWRDWAGRADGISGDDLKTFINGDESVRPDGSRGPGLFKYLRSLQSSNGSGREEIGAGRRRQFKVLVGVLPALVNAGVCPRIVIPRTSTVAKPIR
jgi:type I restriction enzyme M protein